MTPKCARASPATPPSAVPTGALSRSRAKLAAALAREARDGRIVVVDCLTLWLSNLMLAEADLAQASAELAGAVARLAGPAIFVSNEVGGGIVPENALARRFRDAQGSLNQGSREPATRSC